MFALLRAYLKYDPAAKSALEVLLFYPGVKAILLHRLAHALHTSGLPLIPRGISDFSRWLTGIEIHPGARVGRGVVIDHGMGVVIGETSIIGDNVVIYQGVTLGGTSLSARKRHPTVEAGVVIGAGAKILGDITIGANSRIGANAVVIADVTPGSTVIGVAARALSKDEVEIWSHAFDI